MWLQPLTRWPLMHDWQAYFSPSMIGIPLGNYGRLRSSHRAVDGGAMWKGSSAGVGAGCLGGKTARHGRRRARSKAKRRKQ